MEILAHRWFANRNLPPTGSPTAAPNHQHVLAGSQVIDPITQGITAVISGTNYSWIWVDRVEGMGGANNAEWRKIGEHTAHELGHQWHTNHDKVAAFGSEHCDPLRQYSSTARDCTMHSKADKPEFWDGIVQFHSIETPSHDLDSEYVFIRQRPEPVPQQP